jgi:hypothetical protein
MVRAPSKAVIICAIVLGPKTDPPIYFLIGIRFLAKRILAIKAGSLKYVLEFAQNEQIVPLEPWSQRPPYVANYSHRQNTTPNDGAIGGNEKKED